MLTFWEVAESIHPQSWSEEPVVDAKGENANKEEPRDFPLGS